MLKTLPVLLMLLGELWVVDDPLAVLVMLPLAVGVPEIIQLNETISTNEDDPLVVDDKLAEVPTLPPWRPDPTVTPSPWSLVLPFVTLDGVASMAKETITNACLRPGSIIWIIVTFGTIVTFESIGEVQHHLRRCRRHLRHCRHYRHSIIYKLHRQH